MDADLRRQWLMAKRVTESADESAVVRPTEILALALATLMDVPASERDLLTRKLQERER
jgi:hypothetical protein